MFAWEYFQISFTFNAKKMIKQSIISEMNARGDKISHLAKIAECSYPTIFNFIEGNKGIRLDILEKILKHYDMKLIKTY